MDDLISRQAAIDKIKKRLFETAFNNAGIKQNIDETLVDVAENRLENWFNELPSIQPELKELSEWKADFKGYINALNMPKDDYGGIMEYIDEVPSVQPDPCEDAVSREAVLSMIDTYMNKSVELHYLPTSDGIKKLISILPSVQPERKIGRWIPTASGKGRHECSRCHEYAPCYQDGSEHLSTFCVLCGTKMERGEEE